jgi:hypothetical protein
VGSRVGCSDGCREAESAMAAVTTSSADERGSSDSDGGAPVTAAVALR